MRKFLILMIAMLFSTAALAEPSIDVLLKFGVAPSSQINNDSRYEGEPGVSLSPEVFYNFYDFAGIGIGFNQLFKRKIQDKGDFSSSNVYLALKPRLKVLKNEYVYLIGQAGWGMINHNFEYNGEDLEDNGGFYYGIGGGADFNNFVFELLFTSNKAKFKSVDSNYEEEDEYTLMTINIGYRFSIVPSALSKNSPVETE